ncbi:MAG: glycosyltransferase family 1 protein [Proteobacteria bacterium]|nr:glycosyltransferase family 1 protein [Pseudomonadota bacterium]
MNTKSKKQIPKNSRPRIALITNHGYAGVEIPTGGAPDTGGQNFYVNSLAFALEAGGFEITIFARGGFPFFGIEKIREGTEFLSEHVRYVYVPGGGESFIRKEDIAIALDEETIWLQEFVANEALELGVKPWEYFEIVNTHYWDAAVIAVKLIERWKDEAARDYLTSAAGGRLAPYIAQFAGSEVHRLSLSHEINMHLGEIARTAVKSDSISTIIEQLTGQKATIEVKSDGGDLVQTLRLGQTLGRLLQVNGTNITTALEYIDNHAWTPHSLGIIKERNFWNKDRETVRSLKFRERDAHEHTVCTQTKLFCSTSPEISRALLSYHGVVPEMVFDFPPCIDANIFRPRTEDELEPVFSYLSEQSGIAEAKLKGAKVIFETSRMDPSKRKDILLRAFAKVASKIDDVYLFIGGGPASSSVFKELEELKASLPSLDGRGFLLGFVPDKFLEPLFSAADLFVSASEMEGFGMSISQAAAARVAVIASDLIPFATQFAKGDAVVVPAGDVGSFAAAMENLLTNDEERGNRAARLLEVARQLDWKATSGRFVDWFRDKR